MLEDGWSALLQDAECIPGAELERVEASLQFDGAINI